MFRFNKIFKKLVFGTIFSSIFLVRFTIGSYSFLHVFIAAILILFILFNKSYSVEKFFKLDKIGLSFLLLGLSVIISYVFNLKSYNYLEEVYFKTIGNSPPLLYLKIFINGMINLLIAFIAMRTGKILIDSEESTVKLIKYIIGLLFFNSFINVIAWLIQTGGAIGRYNFVPPITVSPGISIQFATLGFLLTLPFFAKCNNQFRKIKLCLISFVFALNIIIIMTRQNQIMFFVMTAVYYMLSYKLTFRRGVAFLFLSLITISIFVIIIANSANADMYSDLSSSDGTDIVVRLTTISSAWNLFIANPVFGVGYGMFVGHNLTPIFITGVETYLASVHNGLMAILAELGIFGLIFYLNMNRVLLSQMNILRKGLPDSFFKRLITAIYSIQIVLCISFLFSNSHLLGPPSEVAYLCYSYLSWLLIGVTLGIGNLRQNINYENPSNFFRAISS